MRNLAQGVLCNPVVIAGDKMVHLFTSGAR